MSDYYFHRETKDIYMLLDDEVCYMWKDRGKVNPALEAEQFHAIVETSKPTWQTFIIDASEFEDMFVLIDKDNFDEIHDWYEFDELTKQKIRNEMLKLKER